MPCHPLLFQFQQPVLVLDDGAAEQLRASAASAGASATEAHLEALGDAVKRVERR
jgi:hypothetical protein